MVSQNEVLTKFRALFVLKDDSIIRHIGSTWIWQETRVTDRLLLDHLARRICIGLCPLRKGEVKWTAFDFDAHGDHSKEDLQPDVLATLTALQAHGIDGHIEDSGRGYHIWVFFEQPLPADPVRRLLARLMAGNHEIYCNGHSIRLPLGAYPENKKFFCCFLDKEFKPFPDQREYLVRRIRPTEMRILERALSSASEDEPEPSKKRDSVTKER